jgi:thioredoxin 1
MKPPAKLLILLGVVSAAVGTMILKERADIPPVSPVTSITDTSLPRLLDLGADKCVPCKLMLPVLEELKKEYAGKLNVEFVDIWKDPEAGKKYAVEMIPTQIFFDPEGRELFRHSGFFGKADILAKWKELGTPLR